MQKVIVTTTINSPTPEIRKFDAMPDWNLIVVGDVKTPEYKLERGRFMHWEEYRDRFAKSNGIVADFMIVEESMEQSADGPRLTIILKAVKNA